FRRVAIVGVGLIGGSLGMSLRGRGLAREVVGVTRSPATIAQACRRGAIDRGTIDPAEGVEGADLVVLAVPPDQVVPMARRVAPHLRAGALLTDVASVKADIVAAIEALVGGGEVAFVGGHPMAGNEGRGVDAAEPGLFAGTAYLLTPTPRTSRAGLERLAELARALDAVPLEMDPDGHDRTVALVSHLPYLVAAALMGAVGEAGPAAGPSLRGATRVAGSPVALWAQICRLNRGPIQEALRAFRGELERLEAALADERRLDDLLQAARAARLRLGGGAGDPERG
ncbi:MAG TPA: prephenate dehydrogenase, partial [bacterium]|nr:prephenate dehydrogenase [bacterium]